MLKWLTVFMKIMTWDSLKDQWDFKSHFLLFFESLLFVVMAEMTVRSPVFDSICDDLIGLFMSTAAFVLVTLSMYGY